MHGRGTLSVGLAAPASQAGENVKIIRMADFRGD